MPPPVIAAARVSDLYLSSPSNSHVTNSRFRRDDNHLLARAEKSSGPSRLACVPDGALRFSASLSLSLRLLPLLLVLFLFFCSCSFLFLFLFFFFFSCISYFFFPFSFFFFFNLCRASSFSPLAFSLSPSLPYSPSLFHSLFPFLSHSPCLILPLSSSLILSFPLSCPFFYSPPLTTSPSPSFSRYIITLFLFYFLILSLLLCSDCAPCLLYRVQLGASKGTLYILKFSV